MRIPLQAHLVAEGDVLAQFPVALQPDLSQPGLLTG